MSFTPISKLRTTFNGGPREYDLGMKTLVLGPTASGKTTLLASLGLLLTGSADDSVGKNEVKLPAELSFAMREDQEAIEVEAFEAPRFDNEEARSLGSFVLPRGKKPKPPREWNQHPWRHPIRALREILSQNPEAIRRDLAPLLFGDEPIAVRRLLAAQVASKLPESMRIGELVTHLSGEVDSERRLSGRRKTLEEQIASAEAVLADRPSSSDLEVLQREVLQARERVRLYEATLGESTALSSRRKELAKAVAELRAEALKIKAEYETAIRAESADGIRPPSAPDPNGVPGRLTDTQRENAKTYLKVLSLGKEGSCPLCHRSGFDRAPVQSKLTDLLAKDERAQEEARRLAQEARGVMLLHVPKSAAQLKEEYMAIVARVNPLVAAIAEIDGKLLEVDGRLKEVVKGEAHPRESTSERVPQETIDILGEDDPTPVETPKPKEINPHEVYNRAERKLASAQAADDSWKKTTLLRNELHTAVQSAADQKLVVEELRRLVTRVYEQRIKAAEEGISRWLPKGHKLLIALETPSGSPTFRLGLVTPEGIIHNPSGGQRAAIYLAMVVFFLERGRLVDIPGPRVLMIPEERAFSSEWLGMIMTALAEAPGQIVLVNLVKPTGYRGKAWKILDLKPAAPSAGRRKKGEAADPESAVPSPDADDASGEMGLPVETSE